MMYDIVITASAQGDLQYFKAYEQRMITEAIKVHLRHDAEVESNHRKHLRPNSLAPWELKIGRYRAFYEIEQPQMVKLAAVGYKVQL
jgi:mRNA-degrading endonuclease RelE of RelBE toxin-antitoxin system